MRLLAAIAIIIIIFFVEKRVFSYYWSKGLSVSLLFSKNYIECGEKVYLIERVTNDKLLPLPVFHLKFAVDRSFVFDEMDNSVVTDFYHRTDVFSIMGRQRIERKLGFVGTKRGVYTIPSANITVKDFFLISSFAEVVDADATMYVLPTKMKVPQYLDIFSGIMGEIKSRRRLMMDETLFRGIRDYQTTDRFRNINWKQSSRGTGLKSNLYDYSQDVDVKILLNLDTESMIKPEKLIEESISLVSSIATDLLKQGLSVSIASNAVDKDGRDLGSVAGGADMAHAVLIDRYLAAINGSRYYEEFLKIIDHESLDRVKNVHYIIVSPYHKNEQTEKLDRLLANGSSMNMIVPYYNTLGFTPDRDYMSGWEVDYYGA